jgi:hypothetical protein
MEDIFLNALKRDPSPQFSAELQRRLRAQEALSHEERRQGVPGDHEERRQGVPGDHEERRQGVPGDRAQARRFPIRALAASLALIAVATGLLTVPAVRASVASFLALFRVTNIVGVRVDPARLDALQAQQLDLRTLIGENAQVVQDPGASTPVVSLDQAASAAGYPLKLPAWLPKDARIIEMSVSGEGMVRLTANATRLRQVMDALGIRDLEVPAGLDGQILTARVPKGVMIRWEHEGRRTRFFQAPSPQITLPQGVDLAALGEIGLRILGLPPADAREFAKVIDWTGTLIVPLPASVNEMRRVEINGNPGIAVRYTNESGSYTNMVVWSAGGRIFGLVSLQGMENVMEMAYSVR